MDHPLRAGGLPALPDRTGLTIMVCHRSSGRTPPSVRDGIHLTVVHERRRWSDRPCLGIKKERPRTFLPKEAGMTTSKKIARRKLSLLQLAQELGNVSKACRLKSLLTATR